MSWIVPAITMGGALLGALGKGGGGLFGKKEKMSQLPTMNQGQLGLLGQLLGGLGGGDVGGGPLGSGMGYLQQMLSGSPESAEAFTAPYMRHFREHTVPSLAERFSALGSGSQSSGAFVSALGQAGAGLEEQLAAVRGQLQHGAMGQLGGLLGYGLGAKPFENIFRPATSGFLGSLAPGIGQGLGMSLGGSFPGMMSGGISSLMNLFKPKPNPVGSGSAGLYPMQGNYNHYTDAMR